MTRRFIVLVFAMLVVAAAQLSRSQGAGQRGLKVLLLYDMEGVTGASKPQDVTARSESYPSTRESLTADVNAAIGCEALGSF